MFCAVSLSRVKFYDKIDNLGPLPVHTVTTIHGDDHLEVNFSIANAPRPRQTCIPESILKNNKCNILCHE